MVETRAPVDAFALQRALAEAVRALVRRARRARRVAQRDVRGTAVAWSTGSPGTAGEREPGLARAVASRLYDGGGSR